VGPLYHSGPSYWSQMHLALGATVVVMARWDAEEALHIIERDKVTSTHMVPANFQRLLAVSDQRGRLLESLLTLAGSEHGRDRAEPVDLAALVAQAVQDRAGEFERHRLRVKTSLKPARIQGDPTLIARLVANLCDNAIHYNEPGGLVEIGTRLDTGRALLIVANTGAVIPPGEVDRLFEPFQRLHRVADDAHHGLGLSIVRAIVVAHGAGLAAYARTGGGLAVEIAFPALAVR